MNTKFALAIAAFLGALAGFAFDHRLAEDASMTSLPTAVPVGGENISFRSVRQEERAPTQ